MRLKRIQNPSMVQSHLKIKEGHTLDKRMEHEIGKPEHVQSHQEVTRQQRLASGGLASAKQETRPSTQDEHNDRREVKRLAAGGAVTPDHRDSEAEFYDREEIEDLHEHEEDPIPVDEFIATHEDQDDRMDRIMRRRAMAQGGQVDLEDNAIEHSNEEDDLSHDLTDNEDYSLSDALDSLGSPKDSNEHGDEEEMDQRDRADRIMLRRAKRK